MKKSSIHRQQTLQVIRQQHEMLLRQNAEVGELDLEQARSFIDTLAQAGANIEKTEERSLLHNLMYYWSSIISNKTGSYPLVQLQPFTDSLDQPHTLSSFIAPIPSTPASYLSPENKRNRQRMIKRVQSIWIEGLLLHASSSATSISLSLHEQFDVVANPWRLTLEETLQSRPLPLEENILQIYDGTGGGLLILGNPGSGKTTLLLELAKDLLLRAEQDKYHPIPVIFNLSSWGDKKQPLTHWIADELNIKYQVPRSLARQWVEQDQILLLLDGLDEVTARDRAACISVINQYCLEHGLVSIVVCSRQAEYLAQEARLHLHKAVVIQPLTEQQIDAYLSNNEIQLETAHKILHDDTTLLALCHSPLMLSIVMTAFQDFDTHNTAVEASVELIRRIFAIYVQRMCSRRSIKQYYTPQRTVHWLSYLAQQLTRHNQTTFYIEQMQMDWLPENRLRWLSPTIVVGLIYGLFIGLLKGFSYAFTSGTDQLGRIFSPGRGLVDGLLIGVLNTFIFVLYNGLLTRQNTKRTEEDREAGKKRQSYLKSFLGYRIIYGLFNGLLNGLFIAVLVDLPAGIYNGLFIGAAYALLGKLDLQMRPAEILIWSWQSLRKNALWNIGFGLLLGLGYGILTGLYWQSTQIPPTFKWQIFLPCLIFGLLIGLVVALAIALRPSISHPMDRMHFIAPGQGIRNSLRNSLLCGGITWLLFGTFFGIIYGVLLHQIFHAFGVPFTAYSRYFPKEPGLLLGLIDGLAIGALFWLQNGGIASILHVTLRIRLWRAGCIPWNYIHFLDFASEQILLHKVGGGYIFIHLLLLEYFASLNTSPPEDRLLH